MKKMLLGLLLAANIVQADYSVSPQLVNDTKVAVAYGAVLAAAAYGMRKMSLVSCSDASEEFVAFVKEILKSENLEKYNNVKIKVLSDFHPFASRQAIAVFDTIYVANYKVERVLELDRNRKELQQEIADAQEGFEKEALKSEYQEIELELNKIVFVILHEYAHIGNNDGYKEIAKAGAAGVAAGFSLMALRRIVANYVLNNSSEGNISWPTWTLKQYGSWGLWTNFSNWTQDSSYSYGNDAKVYVAGTAIGLLDSFTQGSFSRTMVKKADMNASKNPTIVRSGAEWAKDHLWQDKLNPQTLSSTLPTMADRSQYLNELADELETKQAASAA